ncbi:Fpg/Nei family DNA glycosylase [Corynebacterium uropygiale]|uniref:DNA-(apurinic or apyrimidinic site) lyase n=1 Tax=Corynebacterium uropygiale TaxID=1775911 RepID=A0A9X1QVC3_9CORY|nr:DNA-formamidopyrimidine glycosylase family protein [Corynebacterium uropygiale]MCF4007680.1 Fpg/Nei family DNA glycosylase [Corynebacterium uropygiale]
MPEGHVIHRLARTLEDRFLGQTLMVSSPQGRFAREAALLDGHQLACAEAAGKQLFLHFDLEDPRHIVFIHLGLIGKFHVKPWTEPVGAVRLRIATEDWAADLHGPQWCRLITEEEQDAALAKLGEDPLRADADPERLWPRVHRSRRSIAAVLMEQGYFAGVGNIYRAETLFRLGISPERPCSELSHEEFLAIWEDLVGLMAEGVRAGRIDTVRPEHTPEAMHRPPRVDDHGGEVYVYRRAGQPCWVCGEPIRTRVLNGRNLFWCPRCQHCP